MMMLTDGFELVVWVSTLRTARIPGFLAAVWLQSGFAHTTQGLADPWDRLTTRHCCEM
jgi:hypothetical protein